LSAVVKCDVKTHQVSLQTLDFEATTSYGGCSF
jgi:hypothetical protein